MNIKHNVRFRHMKRRESKEIPEDMQPIAAVDEYMAAQWKQEDDWFASLQNRDLRKHRIDDGRTSIEKRHAVETVVEEDQPRLEFVSIADASRHLSIYPHAIRRALLTGSRCLGMLWRYSETKNTDESKTAEKT